MRKQIDILGMIQFFDALKTKNCKIRGKFHELE